MPATTPAPNSSSVHSISSFSMNGSPTWTLGRLAGPCRTSNVSDASTETPPMPSPPVRAPYRIDLVADPRGVREVQVLVSEHADAQRVDQRVADVGAVEHDLAADVRQAEAVAVAADAGHDAGQHAAGVVGGERAEPERVHDGDRPGAHREDVAHDAADAGGRALVGLDVAGVVVRLDLERDGVALADVDDAGVLADARERLAERRLLRQVAELLQVHLARLVGAVLAPHHRVHRQLGGRGTAAEDLADAVVLVGLQPQLGPRLLAVGGLGGVLDGVQTGLRGSFRHAASLSGVGDVLDARVRVPCRPMRRRWRRRRRCSGWRRCAASPAHGPRTWRRSGAARRRCWRSARAGRRASLRPRGRAPAHPGSAA